MPEFSQRSIDRLHTCDPRLVHLFEVVVSHFDCTVLEGHRDQATQEEMLRTGRSKLGWPDSLHNRTPSMAVDVAPYPIDWNDTERFRAFGGFVLGVASQLGYTIRWGGDWDRDWTFTDQSFIDMPHYELRE